MSKSLTFAFACALVSAFLTSGANAQGGPPTELSSDPYSRALVCSANLALAARATRSQDTTVSSAMEDGAGRWLVRAVKLGAAAGHTGTQVQSAVAFNMSMLELVIDDPDYKDTIVDNVKTCRDEAETLPKD